MTNLFNHVGITVSNLDRSLDFYCGVLGLPSPAEGHVFPIEGAWLGRVVGADNPRIRVAFIPLGDGVLELLEYERPANGERTATLANWDTGAAHLALNVVDLLTFYKQHLSTVDFLSEPQTVEGGPWAGGLVVYLRDPDGIPVELVDVRPPNA